MAVNDLFDRKELPGFTLALTLALLAVAACGDTSDAGAGTRVPAVAGGGSGGTSGSAAGVGSVGGTGGGGMGVGGSESGGSRDEAGTDGGESDASVVIAPYVCRGSGTSLQFDGGQIDEVIADLSTDMPAGDASRTIEMWAYTTPKTWRLHHFLFDVGTTGGAKVFGLTFGGRWENSVVVQGGYPDFEIFTDKANGFGIAAPITPSSPNFQETGWTHMAVTYDMQTRLYAFITNGKTMFQGSSWLHEQPAFRTEATPIHIGFSEGFGLEGFDGKIDELRIWNKSRTNDEIVATMHAILKGDEAGLVGNWHFDEGAGTVAKDSTKGHHDAIMVSPIRPKWVKSEGLDLTCP